LEDYVKKTIHKRRDINVFYAALFITFGFP
jgi:hypothetical protein